MNSYNLDPRFPFVRPVDAVAQNILEKRYFHPGESSWDDVVKRVMDAVFYRESEKDQDTMRTLLLHRYFIPNSPTLFNAGTPGAGLSACFVVGVDDNTESIMQMFSDFTHVARKGGGCGVSLSNLRPEGAPVAGSSHGYAAGPVAIYDALCHLMLAFTQGGKRSMAMMGTLSVYHPDILKFIHAKETEGVMTTTNISVVVDDAFMQAVMDDTTYWTEFNGVRYQELRARDVFQAMVDGAWQNGEPGILFAERLNDSPYQYTGQVITATNPCGEQPLPSNGVCNLGSLDLSKFVRNGDIDINLLSVATHYAVRFLDNVIDAQTFPTPAIQQWSLDNRPVGIGIMGFADALLEMGIAYGSNESLYVLEDVMYVIYMAAKAESEYLGELRGVPANCLALPEPRRNITITTIAPTGTIALLAGCSSGIEPVFTEVTLRNDTTGSYQIPHPYANAPHFRCAVSSGGGKEVTWEEHLAVQRAAQRHVDTGVSKTINFPEHTTKETIWDVFLQAWQTGIIKGLTVYRNNSRQVQVLTVPDSNNKDSNTCPSCSADMVREGGCTHCSACEYSVCEIG